MCRVLQQFAVTLTHTTSTLALAQEILSEEDHALTVREAQ
jgi:hypothetical protein